jgi:hypothetical protein
MGRRRLSDGMYSDEVHRRRAPCHPKGGLPTYRLDSPLRPRQLRNRRRTTPSLRPTPDPQCHRRDEARLHRRRVRAHLGGGDCATHSIHRLAVSGSLVRGVRPEPSVRGASRRSLASAAPGAPESPRQVQIAVHHRHLDRPGPAMDSNRPSGRLWVRSWTGSFLRRALGCGARGPASWSRARRTARRQQETAAFECSGQTLSTAHRACVSRVLV